MCSSEKLQSFRLPFPQNFDPCIKSPLHFGSDGKGWKEVCLLNEFIMSINVFERVSIPMGIETELSVRSTLVLRDRYPNIHRSLFTARTRRVNLNQLYLPAETKICLSNKIPFKCPKMADSKNCFCFQVQQCRAIFCFWISEWVVSWV